MRSDWNRVGKLAAGGEIHMITATYKVRAIEPTMGSGTGVCVFDL